MRKPFLAAAGALLVTSVAAGPAWAQSTTTTTKVTTTTSTVRHIVHWRDIAGVYRTKAAADARLAAMEAKGITGFVVHVIHPTKHTTRYEVEETFSTHAAARMEATKVRAGGFTVRIVAV
jgi:cytochrome c551/c552